jgi:transcriptional regulator with XRE-family HTH domain
MSTMRFYKTYNFVDKDPVIDTLRTAVQRSGQSLEQIADASGVSIGTLNGWFLGKTRRPQHATIMAVTRAIGYDWRLIKK